MFNNEEKKELPDFCFFWKTYWASVPRRWYDVCVCDDAAPEK